jgi:hypothetical protein
MPSASAYREVVPNDSVLFEEVLEALRESQLATAVEAREAQARDQDCHVATERLTANSELNATSTARLSVNPLSVPTSSAPMRRLYPSTSAAKTATRRRPT